MEGWIITGSVIAIALSLGAIYDRRVRLSELGTRCATPPRPSRTRLPPGSDGTRCGPTFAGKPTLIRKGIVPTGDVDQLFKGDQR